MIFLTVGTQLAFPRLLDMFAEAAPELVSETFAQTGDPAYPGPLSGVPYLTREQFERRCASARIIVGHAGMGTILAARRLGKPLIVVPRRHTLGEHRNDHQMGTAEQLQRLGGVWVAESAEQLAEALAHPPPPLSAHASEERHRLIATVRDLVALQDRSAPTVASRRVDRFLGLEIDRLSLDESVAWTLAASRRGRFGYVVTPNVDHLVTLHSAPDDQALWEAYRRADLRLNDSRVLELFARLDGLSLGAVPGSDLTRALFDRQGVAPGRVAVVGSTPQIIATLQARYPTIELVAHYPPFGVRADPAARKAIIAFVEKTAAPLTFFAIGSPQSELICRELAERGRARTVALCIGAGLEFLSGHKRRAPRLLQAWRLEWLFRLLQEPRKLGPRYLVRGPRFLPLWFRGRRSHRIH